MIVLRKMILYKEMEKCQKEQDASKSILQNLEQKRQMFYMCMLYFLNIKIEHKNKSSKLF